MKRLSLKRWWRALAVVVAAFVLIAPVARATPPPLTVPPETTTAATGPSGAVVTFTASSGPSDTTSCSPSSGSTFPIGETTVTCTATDLQTNEQTTGTFRVVVTDVPRFAPQAARLVARSAGRPIRVGYVRPVATDFADTSVPVGCTPGPGSVFPVGSTKVTCMATSSHGDTSSLQFDVLVLGWLRPPGVSNLTAKARGDKIVVHWRILPGGDVSGIWVTRRPGAAGAPVTIVYLGRGQEFVDAHATAGVYYTYAVTTFDPGGRPSPSRNASAGFALPELFSPANGARLSNTPTLLWLPSAQASYYNVQLWRNNTRILSRWPRTTAIRLPRSWMYLGKRYTLSRGLYTWYVWPGLGSLVTARYGKMLGHARFTITVP